MDFGLEFLKPPSIFRYGSKLTCTILVLELTYARKNLSIWSSKIYIRQSLRGFILANNYPGEAMGAMARLPKGNFPISTFISNKPGRWIMALSHNEIACRVHTGYIAADETASLLMIQGSIWRVQNPLKRRISTLTIPLTNILITGCPSCEGRNKQGAQQTRRAEENNHRYYHIRRVVGIEKRRESNITKHLKIPVFI